MLGELRKRAREGAAILRQGWLLRADALAPVVPATRDGEHAVLFLHGLFASAGVLRPLRHRFLRHAHVCTGALTYAPGPSVEELAGRLGALAQALPSGAHLHVVGHSLGGVVARYYALHANDARLRSITTLASPFGGVRGAGRFGFARDLDPASPVLASLRAPSPVPHLSLLGADDALTRDTVAHTFDDGEVRIVPDVGHHTILFDDGVGRDVERFILTRAPG